MGYHKNRCRKLPVQTGEGFQKRLRCPGIQSTGRFIRKQKFWMADKRPCAGTPLFLSAGNLVRKFIPDILDSKQP